MRFFAYIYLFVALKPLTIFSRISRKVCILGQTYERGIFMKTNPYFGQTTSKINF